MGLDNHAVRSAHLGNFLYRHNISQIVRPSASVFGGKGHPHYPQLAKLRYGFIRIGRFRVHFLGDRFNLVFGKFLQHLFYHFLFS